MKKDNLKSLFMVSNTEMVNLIKSAAEEGHFEAISLEEMESICKHGAQLIQNDINDTDLIKALDKFKVSIENRKIGNRINQVGHQPSRPGGFWLRFWAWLFDATVLGSIIFIMDFLVRLAFGLGMIDCVFSLAQRGVTEIIALPMILVVFVLGWLASILVAWILSQLIGWMYYALFETASTRGTPGKLLFGLQVLGKDGTRVSFGRATARHFFKFAAVIPLVILVVARIIIAFSAPARDVTKMISEEMLPWFTVLPFLVTPFFFFIFYGMAGWTKQKRALHDILSGCYVVRAKELSALRVLGNIIGVLMTILVAFLFVFIFHVYMHSTVAVSKNSVTITTQPDRHAVAHETNNNSRGVAQPQPPSGNIDSKEMP